MPASFTQLLTLAPDEPGVPRSSPAAKPAARNAVASDTEASWSDDAAFQIQHCPGRISKRNRLSEYRSGEMIVGPQGITFIGHVVLDNERRTFIYLLSFLFGFGFGFFLVYNKLEFSRRWRRIDVLYWNNIEGIAYDRQQERVCVAFHRGEEPSKSYALGMHLHKMPMDDLVRLANRYAPGIAGTMPILPARPLWQTIALGIIFTVYYGAFFYLLSKFFVTK